MSATQHYSMRAGSLTIVLACLMFGGIYFLTPYMEQLGGLEVWAFRVVITLPVVGLVLAVMRQTRLFTDIGIRMRRRPVLAVGVFASGLLLSVQLWLFGWAPLNGRGLSVALGYFLLPLVLVVVGRFLYKDRLRWWHWLAATIAAVGVAVALVSPGNKIGRAS